MLRYSCLAILQQSNIFFLNLKIDHELFLCNLRRFLFTLIAHLKLAKSSKEDQGKFLLTFEYLRFMISVQIYGVVNEFI